MNKMKGKTLLLATLLCLMGSALGCVNVSADDAEMVMEKWSFAQYYQCIRDNYINSPIKPKNVSQYQAYAADDVMQASGKMFLPSYLFQHQVNSGYANSVASFIGLIESVFLADEGSTKRYVENLCSAIFVIPTVPTIRKMESLCLQYIHSLRQSYYH